MAVTWQLVLGLLAFIPICTAGSTSLVINEVDYDQPSTDAAEFIELKNVGTSSINVQGWSIQLVNGRVSPVEIYQTIAISVSETLLPGDHFVICGGSVPNCNLATTPTSNLIQNGANNAIGLLDPSGKLIDAVSYEGTVAGYSVGATAPTDTAVGSQSISRCSDGFDSDNNSNDFQLVTSTPGTSNSCPSGSTPAPTTKSPTPAPTTKSPTPGPTTAGSGFTCKNDVGANVDWWVALKFPTDSSQNPDGGQYAYIDNTFDLMQSSVWAVKTNMQTSARDDALANTLYQLYDNQATAGYAMWNDEYPTSVTSASAGSEGAHAKGVLGMSATQGFYLVHSAPKFPDPPTSHAYAGIYPGQLVYGQSFLCISLPAAQIDGVARFLQTAGLWIYDHQLPSAIAGPYPHFASLIAAKTGSPTSGAPSTVLGGSVASAGGQAFSIFQKSAAANIALYESLVEPSFGISMAWETWQDSGNNLDSCPTSGSTLGSYTIKDVTIPEAQAATPSSATWGVTSDHAKWGVPYPTGNVTACIGDQNRESSQNVRGGGTVCFLNNPFIVKQYTKLIVDVEPCT